MRYNQFIIVMLPARTLQDQMLRNYIQTVFNRYDTDHNGTLDVREMTQFFNDLFRTLQISVTVTEEQSLEAIKSIDQNSDGAVSKEELFAAFRKMLTPQQPPAQNQGYNPNGNVQGYGQGGYGNNQQQYGGYGNQYPNQPYNQNYANSQGYGYNQNYSTNQPYGNNYGYGGNQGNVNPNMNNSMGYVPNNSYGQGANMYQSQQNRFPQGPPQPQNQYNSYNPHQNNQYNPYR